MSVFSNPIGPNLVLSPFRGRSGALKPVSRRAYFGNFTIQRPFLRGSVGVARFGLGEVPFPDPENAGQVVKELFERAEGFLYTIADAAVTSSEAADAATTKQDGDWLSGITNAMEVVLKVLKDGLSTVHVPYAYGFAIILLTILVKAATFPLTKKQVESAMAMQSLTPQIKAIQERYAGDQERIQLETARLYKLAGINPLAGCLPTLATIPIWIGLYRALSNVANEGLLTEGFFWIPSLAGPTTIAARQTGSGITWLFPFVDGHPPLGWSDTLAYLILPVLLVVTQYISVQIMQPPQSNDPNLKSSQAITNFLPLMIGYFALSVPSGLSLYWFTNNILSTAQQVWLRKMGGAKNPMKELSDKSTKKMQSEILKSVSETAAIKKEVKKEEKLTPEGLRPGERFKQLKEQEAQKKREKEEARRKAEETVAEEIQVTADEVKSKSSAAEREDSHHDSTSHSLSSFDEFSANGSSTTSISNDDTRTSTNEEESYEVSNDRKDGTDNLHLNQNIEKD
ncbi:ALBINO3-like protein 1, chloroplastic [Andrographis paniculata]|uniref:ALBINO3-like protein 1, chloroplastic n=1 Tax=Andrographis paniculata TaxID=175694 RepID=UPI0021E724FC|nr:ALBINO3-like protein 1, chloroplastic [Andrographis paniculata]XP_051122169.1 ALBINO3-like protein 1, chloroplastic [Andrographis paniculata]